MPQVHPCGSFSTEDKHSQADTASKNQQAWQRPNNRRASHQVRADQELFFAGGKIVLLAGLYQQNHYRLFENCLPFILASEGVYMAVLPLNSGDEFDLTDGEWAALLSVLRLYAQKHHGWKPGLDLEGVIQASIADWLSGKRIRREDETRETFLIGVLNSKVNHEWEKETIAGSEEEPINEAQPAAKPRRIRRRQTVENLDEVVPRYSRSHHPPDAHREVEMNDLYKKVLKALGSRRILVAIFEGLLQGRKPQELADMLGLSIGEIRSEQKRLARKLVALRKRWLNE